MVDRKMSGRVIVVSQNDGDTVGDCLDELHRQCPDDIDVVVVDRGSTDDSADVAIHHPLPDRVFVVTPSDLQRVLDIATAETDRIIVLRAASRPCPGWVATAMCALHDSSVVVGPERDWGNMAIDVSQLGKVKLFASTDSVEEILRRVHAAGGTSAEVDSMRVVPAVASTHRSSSLPERAAPAADAELYRGTVSVVLCTKDRPQQLVRCLRSLARLADDDHEIIVVDNHREPTVDAAILPGRARLVHEPRPGLDVARNRGRSEAEGGLVAYIDDDCEASPHWLGHLREAFADPELGFVTGRVRPASLAQPTHRYFETCFTFDRGPSRKRFTPWDDRPWFPLWTGSVGTGCNMAFRSEVLADAGGFDELLDVGTTIGGGGDLDMYARLLDRKVIGEYAPEALVWHHHRDDRVQLDAQFRGYGQAIGAHLMKAFIERPGLRLTAARYFAERLSTLARLARDAHAGVHVMPVGLTIQVLRGQLSGPFLYMSARRRPVRPEQRRR